MHIQLGRGCYAKTGPGFVGGSGQVWMDQDRCLVGRWVGGKVAGFDQAM